MSLLRASWRISVVATALWAVVGSAPKSAHSEEERYMSLLAVPDAGEIPYQQGTGDLTKRSASHDGPGDVPRLDGKTKLQLEGLAALKIKEQTLIQDFGPEHPEVRNTRRQIQTLQRFMGGNHLKLRDQYLFAFCQAATLRDRGLSLSASAGLTDKWILENLIPDERFLWTLDGLEAVSDPLPSAPFEQPTSSGPDLASNGLLSAYQRKGLLSVRLATKLSATQRAHLPAVYLQIEGLMALCRPEFANILQAAETQTRIRRLTEEFVQDQVPQLHQDLAGLETAEPAPIDQAELRRISADLDRQIVELLNDQERDRLLNLISKSRTLEGVVRRWLSF